MEKLLPILADRALSLFNRRQLRARDFEACDGSAVRYGRRTVLTAWQEREEERRHPFLDEAAPFGLLICGHSFSRVEATRRLLHGGVDRNDFLAGFFPVNSAKTVSLAWGTLGIGIVKPPFRTRGRLSAPARRRRSATSTPRDSSPQA
jgi:hypothetical protein